MLEQHTDKIDCSSAANDAPAPIDRESEHAQTTVKNTGWTEEEKERMKAFGYDGLDMIRAWYS